jgi:hypothetical protein
MILSPCLRPPEFYEKGRVYCPIHKIQRLGSYINVVKFIHTFCSRFTFKDVCHQSSDLPVVAFPLLFRLQYFIFRDPAILLSNNSNKTSLHLPRSCCRWHQNRTTCRPVSHLFMHTTHPIHLKLLNLLSQSYLVKCKNTRAPPYVILSHIPLTSSVLFWIFPLALSSWTKRH